ncbi:MAG: hypothetical protein AAF363_06615 [Bacteroidota bacterium]
MKMYTVINNGIIPMIYGVHEWDSEGRLVKEIVLKDSLSENNRVSKMILNTTRLTALDINHKEHKVINFLGQKSLTIHGIPSGKHLVSISISKLEPGMYQKLRFYLEPEGGIFFHTDKTQSSIIGMEFIEFNIENGLEINGHESEKFIVRFDLPPFRSFSFFSHLNRFFKKTGMGRKLQGSFGA